MRLKMRLEDAMVYVLATAGYGMTTQRLAEVINNEKLHIRVDGNPVPINKYMPLSAVTRKPLSKKVVAFCFQCRIFYPVPLNASCRYLLCSKNIDT